MSGYGNSTDQAPYNTVSGEQRRLQESRGKRLIGFGIAWFALGLIITIVTYSAASSGGGIYIVAWGPMLYGIISLVRGAMLISRARA